MGLGDGLSEERLALLKIFEERIKYAFENIALLDHAMTHSSSTADKFGDNERLEFFGDAILDFVICEHLFHACPDRREGALTEAKSSVVCRAALAKAAIALDVRPFLVMGRGIAKRQHLPASVFANVYEAIVAAIYMDGGIEVTRRFILDSLAPALQDARHSNRLQNYKSQLQQHLQQAGCALPVYDVTHEQGPEHAKEFHITVSVDGRVLGEGIGRNKKRAEQEAAHCALKTLEALEASS